jgi:hypothetical protein
VYFDDDLQILHRVNVKMKAHMLRLFGVSRVTLKIVMQRVFGISQATAGTVEIEKKG